MRFFNKVKFFDSFLPLDSAPGSSWCLEPYKSWIPGRPVDVSVTLGLGSILQIYVRLICNKEDHDLCLCRIPRTFCLPL